MHLNTSMRIVTSNWALNTSLPPHCQPVIPLDEQYAARANSVYGSKPATCATDRFVTPPRRPSTVSVTGTGMDAGSAIALAALQRAGTAMASNACIYRPSESERGEWFGHEPGSGWPRRHLIRNIRTIYMRTDTFLLHFLERTNRA